MRVFAVEQDAVGQKYKLRGRAEIETWDMLLKADEIDYDRDAGTAEARGNVFFQRFDTGEKINASRVEYNLDDETGKFFDVSGTSPAKIDARPGVLTSSNPFYFQGKWAERQEDRYILYDGFITDCKMPRPWWVLRGPKFDVIPNERALAYNSVFWLRKVPLLYTPAFYKSLKRNPRQSGFLTPNIGNSSRRGKMVGGGYYWAINRSYDLTYQVQYFTERGFAHHADFRGKVSDKTDFNVLFYGVNDKGLLLSDGSRLKQGGFLTSFGARSDVGKGWTARADINYLSSFEFRQNFTESFHEAIFAESRSVAFMTKHWSSFGANIVFDRDEVFQFEDALDQAIRTDYKVVIRKLPEFQFLSRPRVITRRILPVYFSFDTSAAFLHRADPFSTTKEMMDRMDAMPRVSTNFQWKGFSLVPSFGVRATRWSESTSNGQVVGQDVFRTGREFTADLTLPSLERIFKAPKFLGKNAKLKHVIESRATYRDISGVEDFNKIIRFDSTELYANTNEVEVSITNRLYRKDQSGQVDEVLSWQVSHRRYFDPTFGGAVVPGTRNVLLSTADLTGYAFLDQPRSYSPVVSQLRYNYRIGLEWRADYDPFRGHIVNSVFSADWRKDRYYISAGHGMVRNDPVLSPSQNQFRFGGGLGNENRRGWNWGGYMSYDYRLKLFQYASTQVTYNTDCCGFSVQYRRFNFGTRNENQFRVAFNVANIGSFGTLKRQERLF
jgi:LPS-assembly protein